MPQVKREGVLRKNLAGPTWVWSRLQPAEACPAIARWSGSGGGVGGLGVLVGGRRVGIGVGGQAAAVMALNAAVAAMMKPATRQALQEIEHAPIGRIDLIRFLEPDQAESAAFGAAGVGAEMIAVAARHELFAFAFLAFVNGHVTETFGKSPMDPAYFAATLPAP